MTQSVSESKLKIAAVQVDTAGTRGAKWLLDVAGHYARPDVFELTVHTEPRPVISSSQAPPGGDGIAPKKTVRKRQAKR